jgi:hypothetical protein
MTGTVMREVLPAITLIMLAIKKTAASMIIWITVMRCYFYNKFIFEEYPGYEQ